MRRLPVLMLVLMALAGCGKLGPPQPPQPDQFPHQYPKPEALPPGEVAPDIPLPTGPKPEGETGYQ